MEKSIMLRGDRPNWYRGLVTRPQGDYFGSTASLYPNEKFVTWDKKWIVTRDGVMQNVCLHAGAEIFREPGTQQASEIRCSVHNWLYDAKGSLVASPKFCKQERSLVRPPCSNWNGFLIGYSEADIRALDGFGNTLSLPGGFLNADSFWFGKEVCYNLPYPRPLMAINYKDGVHVPEYHKFSFGPVADEHEYLWELGPEDTSCSYSIQMVRIRPNVRQHVERLMGMHNKPLESLGWANFHFWLEDVMRGADTPIDKDIFAVWASIYGNGYMMPELYEGGRFLALSYLVSDDNDRLTNIVPDRHDPDRPLSNRNYVEYYVHKSVPEHLRPEALDKFIAAYEQSAREDDLICETLWPAHQRDDIAFLRVYHEILERGDKHYHDWFLRHFIT